MTSGPCGLVEDSADAPCPVSQFHLTSKDLSYHCWPAGTLRVRRAVAAFLTRHFKPVRPLTAEHVFVTGACAPALEQCGFLLGDGGGNDAILVGRPYYKNFKAHLGRRAAMKLVPVAFGNVDPFSVEGVAKYEEALRRVQDLVNVRGVLLCSPHNPLGRCYPRETLVALMRFCQKWRIHLVSDEIYGLSVWENPWVPDAPKFTSVLAIDPTGLIDPSLIHVLWGMSKVKPSSPYHNESDSS